MRFPAALIAVLFAVPACQSTEDDQVSSESSAIIGGTPASAGQYPQVVAVLNAGLCTGTLIAPDLVLTAAHCVHPRTLGLSSQDQVTQRTSVVLDKLNVQGGAGGRTIAAARTLAVASFSEPGNADIGLIWLSEQVTDREPAVINPDSAAMTGLPVDLVGFGETASGSAGTLMVALAKATTGCSSFGVSDTDFICLNQSSGSGICSGDSGGPAFATIGGQLRVVGITSFGDQTCRQLGAHFRTSAPSARQFLQANAPSLLCADDGACDPACDTDPDCRAACTGDGDCEADQYCAADGFCSPAPYTPGAVGSACEGPGDCNSGLCAANGDSSLCTESCTPGGAASCAGGFDCLAAGDNGVCWPADDGCSTGGGRGSLLGALLALLGVVGLRRRR